jgi:hypothetical protein
VNGGFQPYFRIGGGYEIVNSTSSEEYENWSDAAGTCSFVITIRDCGMAFIQTITGVEIWNEPDNIHSGRNHIPRMNFSDYMR